MLQVRAHLQGTSRGFDEIGKVASELQRSGKRPQHGGANWGRHSSDVMGGHTSGRPSPSDPDNIGSRETFMISPSGNCEFRNLIALVAGALARISRGRHLPNYKN